MSSSSPRSGSRPNKADSDSRTVPTEETPQSNESGAWSAIKALLAFIVAPMLFFYVIRLLAS